MAKYKLEIMHGDRGGEGTYIFDAQDDLLSHSPMTVLKAAMTWLDAHAGVGHIDWEVHAALKNKEKRIVTSMGHLVFHETDHQPYVVYITEA